MNANEPVEALLAPGMRPRAELEPGGRLLSIGIFARRTRLSMKALRLYDRLGLLVPDHVDPETGYRRYREDQVAVARLVALLRRLDMPLAGVSEVVTAEGPVAARLLATYWEAVERRVASQRELAAHLQLRMLGDRRSFTMFEINERDVPEQVVLTEQRHVHVGELPGWIESATDRLVRAAGERGGVVGPMLAIYHGEVNQDSDGPVEICVPVGAANAGAGDVPVRTEPAHHEAYVRLRKAQVEFPQILSAYDAVARWIGERGRTIGGSPREVYFADFQAAGPEDEVCDVAFPVR